MNNGTLIAPDDFLCEGGPVATEPSPAIVDERIMACISEPEPLDWSEYLLTQVYGTRP